MSACQAGSSRLWNNDTRHHTRQLRAQGRAGQELRPSAWQEAGSSTATMLWAQTRSWGRTRPACKGSPPSPVGGLCADKLGGGGWWAARRRGLCATCTLGGARAPAGRAHQAAAVLFVDISTHPDALVCLAQLFRARSPHAWLICAVSKHSQAHQRHRRVPTGKASAPS